MTKTETSLTINRLAIYEGTLFESNIKQRRARHLVEPSSTKCSHKFKEYFLILYADDNYELVIIIFNDVQSTVVCNHTSFIKKPEKVISKHVII